MAGVYHIGKEFSLWRGELFGYKAPVDVEPEGGEQILKVPDGGLKFSHRCTFAPGCPYARRPGRNGWRPENRPG